MVDKKDIAAVIGKGGATIREIVDYLFHSSKIKIKHLSCGFTELFNLDVRLNSHFEQK